MGDARQHYDLARGLEKLNIQYRIALSLVVSMMLECKAALLPGKADHIDRGRATDAS